MFLKWLAVPVIFFMYILASLVSKHPEVVDIKDNKEMTDITV
jgi:hypothetical protein